jgi:DNA/RNA non-specific endonuclease
MSSPPLDVFEALAPGGVLHINYEQLLAASGESHSKEAFGRAIEGEWGWLYEDQTRGARDLRAITIGTFTWLWDATDSPPVSEAENRLVGVYGLSVSPAEPRDKTRMAGFPLLNREGSTRHRGHAVGHSLGGPDEGYNLFGQRAQVNLGGKWRGLERYCARHPGTFMFVRAIYTDDSSTPAALEYGVIRVDGSLEVRQFDNR